MDKTCENCANEGKYPQCWLTSVESFFEVKKRPCDKHEFLTKAKGG